MKSGYQDAIQLAQTRLAALSPAAVCARTGAVFRNGYLIPWLGTSRELASFPLPEQVLILHYLTSEGTKPPTGRLIAYRDAPGALFYESKFEARAVRPIAKTFGADPDALLRAGAALGGSPAEPGDASMTLPILPHLPVTYLVWRGDEEMEAAGGVLFDETAPGWLPAEDLAVLGSLGSYALAGAHKKLISGAVS